MVERWSGLFKERWLVIASKTAIEHGEVERAERPGTERILSLGGSARPMERGAREAQSMVSPAAGGSGSTTA